MNVTAELFADRPGGADGGSRLFAADDPVLPGHRNSPLFGDPSWDLSVAGRAANRTAADLTLHFGRYLVQQAGGDAVGLSPVWLLRAKEVIAVLAAPVRHTSRGRLDVYQVRETSPSTLKATNAHLYTLAVWATLEALPPDLGRWEQGDLDDFAAYLATEHPNR